MSQANPSPDDAQPETTPAQKWTRSPWVEPGSPAFKHLTETASIAPGIIEAANQSDGLREGPSATAWFPHRSRDGAITGVSGDGPDFKTMLRGSAKSLYRLPGSDDTSRIVLTERPLEALAVAQIEKLRHDTLYVATGGSLAMGSKDALRAELKRIKDKPHAELAIATGRGTDAEIAAVQATKLAAEIGTPIIRHRPPDQSFTRHTYLKDNPNADSLTPAATASAKDTANAGAEKIQATGAQPAPEPVPPKKDPLAELLEQLKQAAASSNHDEMDKIRQRINQLITEQEISGVSQQPLYQMKVAWALMDVEKITGTDMRISDDLRKDLSTRGTTMPNLTNSDVGTLLAATRNIPEQKLVQDIRDLAAFVASQEAPQITNEIIHKADQMKDRVIGAVIDMGTKTNRNDEDISLKKTSGQSAQQAAQSAQQTAQSTQQTAQSTQQTAQEATQAAQETNQAAQETTKTTNAAEGKISQNQRAAQTSDNEKGQNAAQAAAGSGGTVIPIRKSGDFLQSLNNIALAWHDRIYGPDSATAKRAAAQHAEAVKEAAARGEPPPPAPVAPPPPSFTAGVRQTTANSDPSAADQPARAARPPSQDFIEHIRKSAFGIEGTRPDEPQTARADAPANWPKTPDQGIDAVVGSLHTTTQDRIDAATARATESAKAAASAVKDLMEGPGREIVARIAGAARVESGNVDAVLSEMRPDGKYAAIRQEYDASLKQNSALAEAVDRAVTQMNAYGEDRSKLESIYRRLERDPEDVEKKFQSLDETLAKAAQAFPGQTPGTAMIENLGEKIREALRQVVARVRQIIGLDPGPTNEPRQDNSPGMGM